MKHARPAQSAGPSTDPLSIRNLTAGSIPTSRCVSWWVLHRHSERKKKRGLVGNPGAAKRYGLDRDAPAAQSAHFVESGCIRFNGDNLLTLDEAAMRRIRGTQIGMIFQEPMTSLTDFSIGFRSGRCCSIHRGLSRRRPLNRLQDHRADRIGDRNHA